jgi:NADH-quinone oxidoreductase subunit J
MVAGLGAVLAAASTSGHASSVVVGTFAVAAAIVLAGAIGVVVARNPVHSALMLVMTLFGIAVLFVNLNDPFLAAVQVIVYAGAIVVLFLFVIMFLGVDRQENIAAEPLRGQRPLAIGLVILGTTGLLLLGQVSKWTTGAPHVAGLDSGKSNVVLLGQSVYTTYLFPFEATAALLVIAVVGAVVLARRPPVAANPEVGPDGPGEAHGTAEPGVGADGAAADPVGPEGVADTESGSDGGSAEESEVGVTAPAGAKGEAAS